MTAIALHQPPELGAVIRQQLRNVRVALRGPGLGLLVGAVVIIVTAAISVSGTVKQDATPFGFTIVPYETIGVWFVALIAAASIWQRDEPSRRGYHLAMPVSAAEHTAIRVGAGWIWLMVWVVGYLALLCLLGLIVAAIGGGHLDSRMSWWGWIVPFAAATMIYLLASIALVASEKPLLWIVGVPAAISGLIVIPLAYNAKSAVDAVMRLLQSPFSPSAPIFPMYYLQPTGVHASLSPLAADWKSGVMATVLWTAIALVGLWLAARHRPAGAK